MEIKLINKGDLNQNFGSQNDLKNNNFKWHNNDLDETNEEYIFKVSIIIPVFNPGKLLYQCLDSVVNQSLRDIEIICVDDGSNDGSSNVLDEYAKKDNRLKVFHQKNKGAGVARNKAIEESSGEFIIFLDSDDWIEKDMCEKLYNHAKKLNSDLVIFDALWHNPNGTDTFNYFSKNDFTEDYTKFTFDYHFILNRLMIASYGVIWSRFYKSSFIKNNYIKFPKHKIYNDVEFCFKTAILANNIAYFPEPFYHYNKLGQPSLQTSFREGKDELIWFDVLKGLYNIFLENNLMDELRLDFINYCIYYSFEKLKNIHFEIHSLFLKKMKLFFEILNPSPDELKLLNSCNLTWYSSITFNYLPLYNEVMAENYEFVQGKMLEYNLTNYKKDLEESSSEVKEFKYEALRKNLINLNLDLNILKRLPFELYDFYMSVINFETYYNFSILSENLTTENYIIKDILWYDVSNSKDLAEYNLVNGECGKLTIIKDYKNLEVFSLEPVVVRVLSPIINDNFEVIFEIKVTDYANVGISSSNNVQEFDFLRVSNSDWRYYRFIRINGNVTSYISDDGICWRDIELTGSSLNSNECQFQFNCGYSNASQKITMVKNIKIYKL